MAKGPQQAYNEALDVFRKASVKFRLAQHAYRAREIGDKEFLAARAEFDVADKLSDKAEADLKASYSRAIKSGFIKDPVLEEISSQAQFNWEKRSGNPRRTPAKRSKAKRGAQRRGGIRRLRRMRKTVRARGWGVTRSVPGTGYALKTPGTTLSTSYGASSLREAQEMAYRLYVSLYGEKRVRDLGITGPRWFKLMAPPHAPRSW